MNAPGLFILSISIVIILFGSRRMALAGVMLVEGILGLAEIDNLQYYAFRVNAPAKSLMTGFEPVTC